MLTRSLYRWLSLMVLLTLLPAWRVEAKRQSAPDLQVLQADESGVVLELTTSAGQLVWERRGQLAQVTLPTFDLLSEPGQPQLPVRRFLIGVPPHAQVTVRLLADRTENLAGSFDLPLAPRPAPLQQDFQPGAWHPVDTWSAADLGASFPASPAVLSADVWLRDWRIVQLSLYPLQYDAKQRRLTLHSYLKVAVQFSGDSDNAWLTPLPEAADPIAALMRHALLNYDTARYWRAVQPASGTSSQADMGARYKIVVAEDGLYHLTYAQLAAAGLDVDEADPRTFHLTSQGQDVAVYVSGEADGSFDPGDYLAFYGQKFSGERLASLHADEALHWITYTRQLTTGAYVPWHPQFNATMAEKYTDENVYWLTVGGTPGPRMPTVNGDPTGSMAPTPQVYRTTSRAERSNRWWTWHFTGEDTWYWEVITDYATHAYTITLSAVASGAYTATVRGEVVAMNTNDGQLHDHHTRVEINTASQAVDDAYWEGKSRYAFQGQVPQADLLSGVNTLKFTYLSDSLVSPPIYFDWFEIEYARRFLASQNRLMFAGEQDGEWKYVLGGFDASPIEIYDVTDPLAPVRVLNPAITSAAGVYTATVSISQTAGAQYLAWAVPAVLSPRSITFYDPPDLKSSANGADYIVITHADFLPAAQTLADFRAQQGLRTRVVDINDVYNEFNEGIFHPIAIKNFLAYAYNHWQPPAPLYVVLIGDSTWNFKGFNPARYGTEATYLPANLAFADPWQGEVDATNQLASLVGSDPLPDLYISRLPVNSLAEANAAVQKILDYETLPSQPWQRNLLFVADNIPDAAGDFEASAETLIDTFVGAPFQPVRLYESDYCAPTTPPAPCPAARHAITQTLNVTGSLLTTYIGHGAVQRWTHEQIFVNADVLALSNGHKLPVVLSLTCMDGYWIGPNGPQYNQGPSLIELMVRSESKGAVSAFSPGGLGVATGHDTLAAGFYQAIFDDHIWQLGPATLAARLNVFASGANFDLIQNYNLIGDPALWLLSPYGFTLSPSSAAQSAPSGDVVTYTLSLTNSSPLTDTFDVSLSGHTWPSLFPATVGPLSPGQSSSLSVRVQIPTGLLDGAADSAQVLARSRGDSHRSASAQLTTTVVNPQITLKIYLPVVRR